jgi:hypothetical protein
LYGLAGCGDEEIQRKENRNEINVLHDIMECDFKNVTLIRLLNGYVAIPNVYYLDIKQGLENASLFTKNRFLSEEYVGSYILLRTYEGENPLDGYEFNKALYKDKEERLSYKGFDVLIMYSKLPGVYRSIIYKDGDLIEIVDTNERLWKAILDTSIMLKESKCLNIDAWLDKLKK